jgi:hypothetical protein
MNMVFRTICCRELPAGFMRIKIAFVALALSTVALDMEKQQVFAQASATAPQSVTKQTKAGSSANPPSGLLGTTEAQAQPLKGGEQFVGSIIEKRNAFKVKGVRESIEIPSNFPVSTYPNNVTSTNFVNSTVGTPVASVVIITRDGPKIPYDWYQKRCSDSGWAITTPPESAKTALEMNGSLYRMSALKDGQQLIFSFMKMKKSPRTIISINWILKSKTG